jgi:hypothetical protein
VLAFADLRGQGGLAVLMQLFGRTTDRYRKWRKYDVAEGMEYAHALSSGRGLRILVQEQASC